MKTLPSLTPEPTAAGLSVCASEGGENRTLVQAAILWVLFGACMTASADPSEAAVAFPILAGHLLGVVLVVVFLAVWKERKRIRFVLFLSVLLSFLITILILPSDETVWGWGLEWLVLTGAATPMAVAGLGFYLVRRSRRRASNG